MLNFAKFLTALSLVAFVSVSFAESDMRANMKSAIVKSCVSSGLKDEALKNINVNEYCSCSANNMIDSMNDSELKQAFLGDDKAIMQNKMTNAASGCLSSNSGAKTFIKSAVYKGCMEKHTSDDGITDIRTYCECTAEKMSVNATPQDMNDFIEIGQGKAKLVETNISNKVMSVAAECSNQVIK